MVNQVGQLMKTEFTRVSEDTAISEAVKRIAAREKGKIACVVNSKGELRGVLTPRDILKAVEVRKFGGIRERYIVGPGMLHFLTSKYAKDIMSAPVSVHVNETIEEAINTMLDHDFYELPVVDKGMKVIGEISYFDILTDALKNKKA